MHIGLQKKRVYSAGLKLENKHEKKVMTLKGSISKEEDLNKFLKLLQ